MPARIVRVDLVSLADKNVVWPLAMRIVP